MKTVFNAIHVNRAEYGYFKQLNRADQVMFLFELYEAALIKHSDGLDLSKVFNMIHESLQESLPQQETPELPDDVEKVDVMIDDDNIMIESNSLVALRFIIYKFFESGYILSRDKNMEKMFRRDKVTKYLRIFRIVDQTSTICIN
jgi:hypothetical protein